MKKLFLLILLPILVNAQYFGERTTDQSFENSNLFFNSYFLNTQGIYNFKDVAPGLFDDPFLNLYLNPSNLPDLDTNEIYIHLDFRGDRTESDIVNDYVSPYYCYDYCMPRVDPRWITTTRTEAQPLVSLGILTYPLGKENKSLMLGGTYQVIYGEDKFYSNPMSIYNNRLFYDSFGAKEAAYDIASYPVKDRYSGKDEMLTQVHMISGFVGYKFNDKLSLGLSLNSVFHSRDGALGNFYDDEYGDTDNRWNRNSTSTERNQEYDHLDLSAGVKFTPNDKFSFGIKGGILNGEAEQVYKDQSEYFSQYNIPEESEEWHYYYNSHKKDQSWNHDGNTKYFSVNFEKALQKNSSVSFYYRYTRSNVNTKTSSVIEDSSKNTSKYVSSYNNVTHKHWGHSSLSDIRTGSGTRETNKHEAMLNFNWRLNKHTTILVGAYGSNSLSEIESNDPVIVIRNSAYNSDNSDQQYNYNSSHYKYENKTLVWDYDMKNWTFQIPIVAKFDFDKWGAMLGVNRIVNGWGVDDVTTAYFDKRTQIENGNKKEEFEFGERYTQPRENITDNFFDVMASFHVKVSKQLKVQLMLDPDFENSFRVSQWWLSFNAYL